MIAITLLQAVGWIAAIWATVGIVLAIWITIESWLHRRRLLRMQREYAERWRKQRDLDENGQHEYIPKRRARFLP